MSSKSMIRRSIVMGALVLSTAAFAQSLGERSALGERSGTNSVLGLAPKTADFVSQAALSDMTEIDASRLAAERGPASQKSFANQMVTDHSKTSSELRELVSSSKIGVSIPKALDKSHQSKIDNLKAAKPDRFAAEYKSMQVSAHKDAVSLFERYADKGDNPAIKTWAAKTLPDLKHHLKMAQALPEK
jgi:putative membrane protein